MKKIICAIAVVLSGCVAPIPQKTIPNTKCIKGVFEIQQVVDEGFLLSECQYLPYTGIWHCPGPDAFFKVDTSKEPWNSLAEGMQLRTPENATCLVHDGTYKYTTAMGRERTVINLGGELSEISNPEYETWKAEQDVKANQQEAK